MVLSASQALAFQSAVSTQSLNLDVGKKKLSAQILTVDLNRARIKIGLAGDKVGQTEPLEKIAKRNHAIAGINGSYFEAYVTGKLKMPNHTLITDARLLHKGNAGSVFGVMRDGSMTIGRPKHTIEGIRNTMLGRPQKWVAYWLNRLPTSSTVTVFNSDWGPRLGLTDGSCIVVTKGVVTAKIKGDVLIPDNGFVIYFRDSMMETYNRFMIGDTVTYAPTAEPTEWGRVVEAVGAGPALLKDGQVVVNPQAEGFSDPKILTGAGARSVIGWTKDRKLKLVVTSGTMNDIASVMKLVGCTDAMNLDGGASSCLWLNGRYIRKPGRDISNALLILPL